MVHDEPHQDPDRLFLLTALLVLPGLAQAANSVVAGTFDGTEAKSAPLPGTCGGSDPLAYQVVDTLRVSVTGDYTVFDALWLDGIKNRGVDVSDRQTARRLGIGGRGRAANRGFLGGGGDSKQ